MNSPAQPSSPARSPLSVFVGPGEIVFGAAVLALLLGLVVVLPIPLLVAIAIVILGLLGYLLAVIVRPRGRRLSQALHLAITGAITGHRQWYRRLPLLMGIRVTPDEKREFVVPNEVAPDPDESALGSASYGSEFEARMARESQPATKRFGRRNKAARAKAPQTITPQPILGLDLIEVPHAEFRRGRLGGVGVVFDNVERTATAVLPLTLALPPDLDGTYLNRVATAWSQAVEALLESRSLVKRVTWMTRVTRPVTPIELEITDEIRLNHPELDGVTALSFGPQALEWPKLSTDQTFVSVTVDARRIPTAQGFGVDPERAAVEHVLREIEAVAAGIEHFGFTAGAPLSPAELVQIAHRTADPSLDVEQNLEQGKLLAEVVGVVPALDTAPEIDGSAWHFARFNESYHRGYWVSEWPLAGADEFDVNHPLRALRPEVSGIQTVVGVYSRGGVPDAPLAHLRADYEAKLRGAKPEQATVILLSAPSAEHLGVQSEQLEYAGLRNATEFRPLHGRHEAAVLLSLPFGRFV